MLTFAANFKFIHSFMVHPDTFVKITPKGYGLFARRAFKRGEIIWLIDEKDVKIPLETYRRLPPEQQQQLNIYSYLDVQHRVILPWDAGKYVNHSCEPNSAALLQFDNVSIALRDIQAEEEIVEDYQSYYGQFERFQCQCGAKHCRGEVAVKTDFKLERRLDIHEIIHDIKANPQALLDVPSEENRTFLQILEKQS